MPQQPNRNWHEAAMDMDDYLDLRATSSKKTGSPNPKKRQSRGSRKSDLRDAMMDPDTLDEYMDEFE